MLNKLELVQSFCGRMPFLSPTNVNHTLDLILTLTTKTPEQGEVALLPLRQLSDASTLDFVIYFATLYTFFFPAVLSNSHCNW